MTTARTIRTSHISPLAQPVLIDAPPLDTYRPALQIVLPSPVQNTIHIERLILHALNNQRGDPDLVDAAAELTDEAKAFFADHISAASERAEWGAEFTEPDGEVPAQCRRLLGTSAQFVDASKALACRLFENMRARPKNISAGDFVAIVYHSGHDATRRIALLKLELDSRWARTFSGPAGRRRVRIAIAQNLFADTKRLQKCALLVPISDPHMSGGTSFEITLLDTQASPRAAEAIAGFFYRGFLTTSLFPTPRRQTREFLHRTNIWLSHNHDLLTPAELSIFMEARRAALRHNELRTDAFASAALPTHPEMQPDLIKELTPDIRSLPGLVLDEVQRIAIDRDYARPLVEHVVLEMDGGATLKIPSERYREMITVEPRRTPENKTRIIIETLTFKEVIDR